MYNAANQNYETVNREMLLALKSFAESDVSEDDEYFLQDLLSLKQRRFLRELWALLCLLAKENRNPTLDEVRFLHRPLFV